MENLGKENFWNEMKVKHPHAVDLFCKWIDEYKEITGWNKLFGGYVKFHDLPYELQMGIMNRFFIESFAGKKEYVLIDRSNAYRLEMEEALSQLEEKLTLHSN